MQNEELLEEYEDMENAEEMENGVSGQTQGEADTEISEDAEQGNEEDIEQSLESVSDGDSTYYDEKLIEVINGIINQQVEKSDMYQTYVEERDMTLFEKPLEKYTVTEGLLLLIFILLLFMALLKLIGGIITCKV